MSADETAINPEPIKDFDQTLSDLEQAVFVARRALASGLLPYYATRLICELANDFKQGVNNHAKS